MAKREKSKALVRATKASKKKTILSQVPSTKVISLPEKLESVLVSGNLADLTSSERLQYYNAVCKSLKLNPLTKPFDYITLSGRLTLYARKDCTEQLRKMNGVSVYDFRTETKESVFIYTAFLQDATGRRDIGTGVVAIAGLRGNDLANAIMKAETKAKRRGPLSICGLGMLDEREVETLAELPQSQNQSEQLIMEPQEITPELKNIRQAVTKQFIEMKKSKKYGDEEIKSKSAKAAELKDDIDGLKKLLQEWTAEFDKK